MTGASPIYLLLWNIVYVKHRKSIRVILPIRDAKSEAQEPNGPKIQILSDFALTQIEVVRFMSGPSEVTPE